MLKQDVLISFVMILQVVRGLYIKPIQAKDNNKNSLISDSEWSVFKNKLGLTDSKVEMLKTQQDQKATAELLKRFIKENPKYITVDNSERNSQTFHNVYKDMIKRLQSSKATLKASLNFEVADPGQKNLKRSRRKIAVKMVSDIPSEKIDDLLKMFNEEHGLNYADSNDDAADAEEDYSEPSAAPITKDSDYMYENLWEDEEVPNLDAASNRNTQLGSFQDLILKANHQRWQREMEDAKFENEHFV